MDEEEIHIPHEEPFEQELLLTNGNKHYFFKDFLNFFDSLILLSGINFIIFFFIINKN